MSKSGKKKQNKHSSHTASARRLELEAERLPAAGADPSLLDNAKTQWQLGEWEALASIDLKTIEAHPERVSLAMLCGAAHQQLNQLNKSKELMNLARNWGASKSQVVQVMAAGIHNVLGGVTALNNLDERTLKHYQQALVFSGNANVPHRLVQARISVELKDRMANGYTAQSLVASFAPAPTFSKPSDTEDCLRAKKLWCKGNWQALAKLETATLPEHFGRVELGIYAACGHQQMDNGEAEQRCVKAVLKWGGEKARVKRFLLSGIYNRIAKANVYACTYDEAIHYFKKSLELVSPDISNATEYLEDRIVNQLKSMPEGDIKEILSRI